MISRIALALAPLVFSIGGVAEAALPVRADEESPVPTLSPTLTPTDAARRLLGYVRGTPAPNFGTPAPTGPPTAAARRLQVDLGITSPTYAPVRGRHVAPPAGMCFRSGPTDDLYFLPCLVPSETDCVDLDSEDVKWAVCWTEDCPFGTGRKTMTCCQYRPCTDTPTSGPTRLPTSPVTTEVSLNGNGESESDSESDSDSEEAGLMEAGGAADEAALSREERIAIQIEENAACRSGLELEYRYYTKLCRMVNQEECGRYYYRWYDSEAEKWSKHAAPCQWMPSKSLWMGSKCVASTACMKEITWTPLKGNRTTSFPSIASAHDDFPVEPTPTFLPTASPPTSATSAPTALPTSVPTSVPTAVPSQLPTQLPTASPSLVPTVAPTHAPTAAPTPMPSVRVQADAAAFEPRCGKLAKYKSKIRSGRVTFEVDSAFSCYKKCTESVQDFVRWSFAPTAGDDLHSCDCFQAFVKLNFKNSKGHFGYTTLDSKPICGSAKISRKAKKVENGGVSVKLKSSYRSPETCLIACAAGDSEHDTFDSFNFKKGKCTCMIGDLSVKLGQAYGSISSI